MKTASIILPVRRQRPGLSSAVRQLYRQASLLPLGAEVLAVVPPGTTLKADDRASAFVQLRVLETDPADSGADPTRRGVLSSTGDYVLVLRQGCGVPLAELLKLIPHFDRGAHVVIGSAYLGQSAQRSHSWRDRLAHSLTSFIANQVLMDGIRDLDGGFVCYLGPVARQVYAMARTSGRGLDLEALALARRLGYTMVEVPVHCRPLPVRAADRAVGAFSFLFNLLLVRWRTGGRRRRLAEQAT